MDILIHEQLHCIQNKIKRLFTLCLSGTYLSNQSKIYYPFLRSIHKDLYKEIDDLKSNICDICGIRYSESSYQVLAYSIRWFKENVNNELTGLKSTNLNIFKIYNPENYKGNNFKPVNRLCKYVKKNLEAYLIDAYIHGSLSTMDYTGYSDFDTIFIIKQEVLEDPQKLKELEKRFIKSIRFLYEYDPLQHHAHFFLIESDLKFYNQSFLPLSAMALSTSLLGRGTNLTFHIRNSEQESEHRFIESIKIVQHYIKNPTRLNNPYYLKGFLSHFMILPVLFLQLKGDYISKKDSFKVMKEQIPDIIWNCMERISLIRKNWKQTTTPYRHTIMKMIGLWNPLLLPFFAINYYKCNPVKNGDISSHLLSEMHNFTEYLLKLSGIDEERFEYRKS